MSESKEQFYKDILDNIAYEVFVTDSDGIIKYTNKFFTDSYCYKIEDVLGQHVDKISKSIKTGKPIIPLVLKSKKEVSLFQETINGKKLFLTAKPIFSKDNKIKLVVESGREVISVPAKKRGIDQKYQKSQISNRCLIDKHGDECICFSKSNILTKITKISQFDITVLLLGKSGTGKSTCAQLIHNNSSRKDKKFITINCTTIPESLIESELFGYVKGAFTGAVKEGKKGLVEIANGGTLFLDEIGDLPLKSQSKLLELIQEKKYLPIGGSIKKEVDVRIIAATNKNLSEMVRRGEFREDLYYRLNVIEMEIPALKDRKEEIPILINIFLEKFNKKYNLEKQIGPEGIQFLVEYNWPGNIRELKNFIEKLVVTTEEKRIDKQEIENYLNDVKEAELVISKLPTLKQQLESAERELIIEAYSIYKSSYKIAEVLQISQSQASRKIRKYILK